MKISKLALIVFLLALPQMAPNAHAQVSLDVSKITCEQFLLWKVTDPDKIVIWLSGYHHAKRGSTILDPKGLEEYSSKLRDYCRNNYKVTVMQAVETLLGPAK